MKSTLPAVRILGMAICVLSLSVFYASAVSAFVSDSRPQCVNAYNSELSDSSILLSRSDGVSIGMTKKEVYDIKGVPDKINRLSGEQGKEMWVYRCQNDDGFDEDCLYLYFDGDRLSKVDRL